MSTHATVLRAVRSGFDLTNSADADLVSDLIVAARRQDEDAVVALIRANERSIAAGLRSAGLHPADANYEDAQNQALLAVWQQFPSYRGDSRVGTWMFSIARRTALSRTIDPELREGRRRARNVERTTALELVDRLEDQEIADRDLLSQVLSKLSVEDREVLLLRLALELPMQEVAATLFLSKAGAKARFQRAKRRAQALARQLGAEET